MQRRRSGSPDPLLQRFEPFLERNGAMLTDEVASKCLNQILKELEPLMTWKKQTS